MKGGGENGTESEADSSAYFRRNTNRLTKDEMKQRLESEKRWKAKSDKVRPPTWLDSVAKKEFKRIAGITRIRSDDKYRCECISTVL